MKVNLKNAQWEFDNEKDRKEYIRNNLAARVTDYLNWAVNVKKILPYK